MENSNNIKYSDMELEHQIGCNESISIKKRIEMYTKRFVRVFDVKTNETSHKTKKSKTPNLLRSKNNKNSQETNVVEIISKPPPTEIIEDSFIIANNEEIPETSLLENEMHTRNITFNDTQENRSNLSPEHTAKSSNFDQTDYMPRMESFLNNFNATYAHLITPKKDRTKRSSDEKNDKENETQPITIGKVEEVIQSQISKKQNGESNMEDARKQDCMLSNNCLLEKAINQMRVKLKQFFEVFDISTGTFKSSQNDLNNPQVSTKNFVGNQSEKLVKIDVLEIIKHSKGSRTDIINNQRSRSPERHFDLYIKSNKSSSLSSKNSPVDIQELRKRSVNFHSVFAETDQKLLNMAPDTSEGRTINLPELISKKLQEKEENGASDEETAIHTSKTSKENKQNYLQASEELPYTDSISHLQCTLEKRSEKSLKDTSSNEEEDTNHLSDDNTWFSNEIEIWETHSQHTDEKMEITPRGSSVPQEIGQSSVHSTRMPQRPTREFMSNTIHFEYDLNSSIPTIRGFLSLPNLQEVMMDDTLNLNHGRDVCDHCGSFIDEANVEEESYIQDQNMEAELSVIEECNLSNLSYGVENCDSSTSSYGQAKCVCDPISLNRDSIDIQKSLEEITGQKYTNPDYSKDVLPSSPEKKNLQSQNIEEEEELDDNVGQPEGISVPTQSPGVGLTTSSLLTGGNTQKFSDMFSLPACNDEIIVDDSSETITDVICKNLQSTCVYFEENKTVSELVGVLLPEESDMDSALEKLGTYEDFEKVLLQNNRTTSETNQTI